ncbi:MAG: hypothetical protein V1688_01890 [bacterium]
MIENLEQKNEVNLSEKSESKKHEPKKEVLYKKIDTKIAAILEMREFAEDNANLPSKQLAEKINLKLNERLEYFVETGMIDDAQLKKFEQGVLLCREYEELQKKIKSNVSGLISAADYDSEEEIKKFSEIVCQLSETEKQLKIINSDIDLQFLIKLRNFDESIFRKRFFVEGCQKQYESSKDDFWRNIINIFKNNYNLNFDGIDTDNIKISFDGCSVIFELNKKDYEKLLGEHTLGTYLSDSPFILIKDCKKKNKVLRHEKNHNLSDSFCERNLYSKKFIDLLHIHISSINICDKEEDKNSAKKRLEKEIKNYVYKNFNEVIADADGIAEREINAFLNNFLDLMRGMDKMSEEIKDEEIKDILNQSKEEMKNKIVEFFTKLSNIFFVADRMGETKQAKGAVVLFQPEQTNRMEKYFKHRYGEGKYEIYAKLKPLACAGSYFKNLNKYFELFHKSAKNAGSGKLDLVDSLVAKDGIESFCQAENLDILTKTLDAAPFKLKERDKKDIIKSLPKIKVFVEKLDITKRGELDKYFKKLGTQLQIDDLKNFINN